MSRRNRRYEAPVTLFSFQDIICGVTGILILVTLLLALDLARRPPTFGSSTADPSLDWVALQAQLEEAQKHQDELQARLSRSQASLAEVTRDTMLTPNMLETLQNKVNTLRQHVQQQQEANDQSEEAKSRLAALLAEAKQAGTALEQRAEQLRQQIALIRAKVRVTFIGGRADRRKPFLVECALNEVCVAEVDDAGDAHRVQQFSGPNAIRSFLTWALSRDSDREWYVLLMRPDAAQDFDRMRQKLEGADFVLGWDVWPEVRSLFKP